MADVLVPGARVRVVQRDVAVHTRAPAYVRGRVGTLVEAHGEHPLPDAVVGGQRPPARGTVWAVTFSARELFGEGGHVVTVNLWEQYLRCVEEGEAGDE